MAQVDVASGRLLWRNGHFDELLLDVGTGDPWAGQQTLFRHCLFDLTREKLDKRLRLSVGSGTLSLLSRTQVVKTEGVDRVLWVIQLVPDSPPSLQSCLLYTSPSPRDS
eukprot:TRINITY_DN15710_c0_g1_i1.p1 TRINITY_DN15710_c0_g1~~TRINITY_DN15710_c0_g1_i1.p1  ORF type:complete len:109 (-),score=18.50 TRINITY_DN15710_c0_g1_i1:146-472(-)